MKKGYSIYVSTTDSALSRSYFISRTKLRLVMSFIIIVFILLVVAIISYSGVYLRAAQVEILRRRNNEIEREFTKLSEIKKNLEIAEVSNQKLKIMLGVDKSPEPVEPEFDSTVIYHFEESSDTTFKGNIPSMQPTQGPISQFFTIGHEGLDFAAPRFAPVVATASGIVADAGWDSVYGNYIIIKHDENYSTFYGHLQSIDINIGNKVSSGELIGTVGSTGRSTSPHLHYEIRFQGKQVDPLGYLPYYTKL